MTYGMDCRSIPLDEKRESHTIAGLLMEHLQRIPTAGETVEIDGFTLKVLSVENHRVQRVQIIPPVQEEDALNYEV